MGRPSKLTPDLQARIAAFLGAGAYIETAASAAGVSKQTLYNWLRLGSEGQEPYDSFLDAVEKAQGEADIRDLKTIRDAASKGVWQAAAWRLERRHPGEWGRRRPESEPQEEDLTLVDLVGSYASMSEEALRSEIVRLDDECEQITGSTITEPRGEAVQEMQTKTVGDTQRDAEVIDR